MKNKISVVIGSWGSYNSCNSRALGSKWLDFSDFDSWEEIEEELTKEGFRLKGIDEELFIQDIEGIDDCTVNWDYQSPERLFNTLYEAGVLTDDYKYKVFTAFIEVRSYSDFEELVKKKGEDWDDDIHLLEGYSWDSYGREVFENCGNKIDDAIDNFFDFEGYGEYMGDGYVEEYSDGLIEIE
jgi:hypothetical protein